MIAINKSYSDVHSPVLFEIPFHIGKDDYDQEVKGLDQFEASQEVNSNLSSSFKNKSIHLLDQKKKPLSTRVKQLSEKKKTKSLSLKERLIKIFSKKSKTKAKSTKIKNKEKKLQSKKAIKELPNHQQKLTREIQKVEDVKLNTNLPEIKKEEQKPRSLIGSAINYALSSNILKNHAALIGVVAGLAIGGATFYGLSAVMTTAAQGIDSLLQTTENLPCEAFGLKESLGIAPCGSYLLKGLLPLAVINSALNNRHVIDFVKNITLSSDGSLVKFTPSSLKISSVLALITTYNNPRHQLFIESCSIARKVSQKVVQSAEKVLGWAICAKNSELSKESSATFSQAANNFYRGKNITAFGFDLYCKWLTATRIAGVVSGFSTLGATAALGGIAFLGFNYLSSKFTK